MPKQDADQYLLVSGKPSDIAAMDRYRYEDNEFVVYPFVRHGKSFAIMKCPERGAQYQADRYSSGMFYAKLFPTLNHAKEGLEGLIY